ncbi:MAG: ImmA/IrrE family metallo-endopeptidase [Acidobacteria bacterium]|nr:ImmA/IrrE family metallo-endopeptidase [Acidobacteriota bacterium]
MVRVTLNPGVLRWARERAGRTAPNLARTCPKLERWERGDERPTLKQVERFAKAVHVPVGYLFLPEPPVESVPIPDFRTVGNVHVGRPSPDLLDTIYVCQQRQEWYRDFARSVGEEARRFVGSARVADDVESTAAVIRDALRFDLDERRQMPTWTEALRRFIGQADALGILVMCSGVVLNNNRRRLDPEEFRGFAMADGLAPLIFINGADTTAAQMFTLAHELAHMWIGQSAISDAQAASVPEHALEGWCNRVAAELLAPLAVLRAEYQESAELWGEVARLARRFKVSTLVVLRRIHDAGALTSRQFGEAYEMELRRLRALPQGGGGDFYLTQAARVSKRFARALVVSTLEGQTLHRDAFRMLGISKTATFHELGRSLGVWT